MKSGHPFLALIGGLMLLNCALSDGQRFNQEDIPPDFERAIELSEDTKGVGNNVEEESDKYLKLLDVVSALNRESNGFNEHDRDGLASLMKEGTIDLEKKSSHERKIIKTLRVGNGGQWGTWRGRDMCQHGSYAAGFRLRVEPPQGGGDDTAGNAVRLFCKTKKNQNVGFVQSYEGLWGNWHKRRDCVHTGTTTQFITSFSLKVERPGGDDTAMNNIRVRCRQFEYNGHGYTLEGDGGGPWGSYGGWSDVCPPNSAVCGLKVKFEGYQGGGWFGGDNTALNDVELYCCND